MKNRPAREQSFMLSAKERWLGVGCLADQVDEDLEVSHSYTMVGEVLTDLILESRTKLLHHDIAVDALPGHHDEREVLGHGLAVDARAVSDVLPGNQLLFELAVEDVGHDDLDVPMELIDVHVDAFDDCPPRGGEHGDEVRHGAQPLPGESCFGCSCQMFLIWQMNPMMPLTRPRVRPSFSNFSM